MTKFYYFFNLLFMIYSKILHPNTALCHAKRKHSIASDHPTAVLCTDLSSKETHKQAGVDRVIASGSLDNVMASILAVEWQEM